MRRLPGETFESFRTRCKNISAYVKQKRRGFVVWPSSTMGTFRMDGKRSMKPRAMR